MHIVFEVLVTWKAVERQRILAAPAIGRVRPSFLHCHPSTDALEGGRDTLCHLADGVDCVASDNSGSEFICYFYVDLRIIERGEGAARRSRYEIFSAFSSLK